MTKRQLLTLLASGEDSTRQFKEDIRNAESLAAEMVVFSNTKGGRIFIGVRDNGDAVGLSRADIARINQLISPGHLPNNLTVEKIRTGNSNIRNPILVSYAAKGLLPYHGLGSGIKRVLEEWSDIKFVDDHEGCLFTVTVARNLKG
jgi:predicted HTH transcriptional regulator